MVASAQDSSFFSGSQEVVDRVKEVADLPGRLVLYNGLAEFPSSDGGVAMFKNPVLWIYDVFSSEAGGEYVVGFILNAPGFCTDSEGDQVPLSLQDIFESRDAETPFLQNIPFVPVRFGGICNTYKLYTLSTDQSGDLFFGEDMEDLSNMQSVVCCPGLKNVFFKGLTKLNARDVLTSLGTGEAVLCAPTIEVQDILHLSPEELTEHVWHSSPGNRCWGLNQPQLYHH
ncbi:MAG: hypothetical protein H6855_00650 [Rhodospirillales bacterium]|nr:hypothetical protein [Rhodospirillales bacterium]MCB9964578.1 hypothetical protein [Rhodospirillales bacterium]MCB9973899.1 hypothetical protein [Rhodospirillales bacterium]MCB9980524.1 hypothetical protein [Rhodospirillales bacterium]